MSSVWLDNRTDPVNINVTSSLGSSSGDGADPGAQYIVNSVTASLANERALAVGTGLTKTDGGAGGNLTIGFDDDIIATVSGTNFTGPVKASGGISGSMQRTPDGSPLFVAGANVTITSGSGVNGQITIAAATTAGSGDPNAQYVVLSATGSLNNERVLTAGGGVTITDAGAGAAVTLGINNGTIATISGSTFTQLSGSLQKTAAGLSYLVAGTNMTVTSASNGQITLSATGGSTASGLWVTSSWYNTAQSGSHTWNATTLASSTGFAKVIIVGGGGGGGGSTAGTEGGGSGAAGAVHIIKTSKPASGSTKLFVVGYGGAGGSGTGPTSGRNGGHSWFEGSSGAPRFADPGSGGSTNGPNGVTGGAAATMSVDSILTAAGGSAGAGTAGGSQQGGASYFGGGGMGTRGTAGDNGKAPGSGGGGAAGGVFAGGAGATGAILVEEYT